MTESQVLLQIPSFFCPLTCNPSTCHPLCRSWLHSSINMTETQVPVWILAIGGVGLVLGLLTYG